MDEEIKRFLLFAGDDHYPRGGWSDFHSSYDTLAETIGMMHSAGFAHFNWCQVVDVQTGKVYVPADQEYMR